jgi:endonuclease YncB( thermonuclease family)
MSKICRFILTLVCFCVVAISYHPSLTAAQPISITIDNRPLLADAPPIIHNGRVLVPLRAIFEALGATVRWDAGNQTITGERGGKTVILRIGSLQATVSGRQVPLDVPPAIISGRTMVPTRFIAESLGARVDWDERTRTVALQVNDSIQAGIKTIPVQVTSVIDGDTIRVRFESGLEERVRLIGVDTPESTNQIEPFGRESAAFTQRRIEGRAVFLETDVSERDRFGRLLAYVWLLQPINDSEAEVRAKMFNAELLLQGYARIMSIAPNIKYADMFLRFERDARGAGRGLWAATPPVAAPTESVSGIVITSVDLVAEFVTIQNRSRGNIDISGWVLLSERGGQRFIFPQGIVISPGSSIRVVSGPNATTGANNLLWTRSHIWNNDGDPVVLLDNAGREISRK